MHTNSTPNLELSQFVSTDKPTWLGDVNGDMLKIDTAYAAVGAVASGADSKADTAISTANTASTTATDAATLANTANTNAQSALTTAGNAATAAQAAGDLAQTAKTTADGADTKATTNASNIGDLTTLTTTAKNNLVAAINEIDAKPAGGGTAADITYDNTTSGLTATDVQAAIDELSAGLNPPVFTWNGLSDAWTPALPLEQTGVGPNETVTPATGILPRDCTLYYNLNSYQATLGTQGACFLYAADVETPTTWIVVASVNTTASGNTAFNGTFDLSTYAGKSMQFKVLIQNNTAGQTQRLTATRFDVTNAGA